MQIKTNLTIVTAFSSAVIDAADMMSLVTIVLIVAQIQSKAIDAAVNGRLCLDFLRHNTGNTVTHIILDKFYEFLTTYHIGRRFFHQILWQISDINFKLFLAIVVVDWCFTQRSWDGMFRSLQHAVHFHRHPFLLCWICVAEPALIFPIQTVRCSDRKRSVWSNLRRIFDGFISWTNSSRASFRLGRVVFNICLMIHCIMDLY